MVNGKGLNDEERSVIIKECAKGTSLHVITEKLAQHGDMVRGFLKEETIQL